MADNPNTALMFSNAGSSAIVKQSAADLASSLRKEKEKTASGYEYLKFSGKTGFYEINQDNYGQTLPGYMVVDPTSLVSGWMCFKNNSLKKQNFVSIYSGETPEQDLTEFGPFSGNDGWKVSRGMAAMWTRNGKVLPFAVSSVSGNRAFGDFFDDLADAIEEAGGLVVPVVKLTAESFQGKDDEGNPQTNYKPNIEIVAYLSGEDAAGLSELEEKWFVYVKKHAVLVDGAAWPNSKAKARGSKTTKGVKRRSRSAA